MQNQILRRLFREIAGNVVPEHRFRISRFPPASGKPTASILTTGLHFVYEPLSRWRCRTGTNERVTPTAVSRGRWFCLRAVFETGQQNGHVLLNSLMYFVVWKVECYGVLLYSIGSVIYFKFNVGLITLVLNGYDRWLYYVTINKLSCSLVNNLFMLFHFDK